MVDGIPGEETAKSFAPRMAAANITKRKAPKKAFLSG
jgi:hypothetical protein